MPLFLSLLTQETHYYIESQKFVWSNEWGGRSLWSSGINNRKGVAVLFKWSINNDVKNVLVDKDGRFIKCLFCMNDCEYYIMNVYCLNNENDRVDFFNNIDNLIEKDMASVKGCDFNCTLYCATDCLNCKSTKDAGRDELKMLSEKYMLFIMSSLKFMTIFSVILIDYCVKCKTMMMIILSVNTYAENQFKCLIYIMYVYDHFMDRIYTNVKTMLMNFLLLAVLIMSYFHFLGDAHEA